MTKPCAAASPREHWCFDTVWRQRGRMRRQKQASLHQSIVHLSKALTQSEMRDVRLGQTSAAALSRGRVGVEVWEEVIDLTVDICGIYQEVCQSSERGSEGQVEWVYVSTCDEVCRQQQQDKQVHSEFTRVFFSQSNISNLFSFLSVPSLFVSASPSLRPGLHCWMFLWECKSGNLIARSWIEVWELCEKGSSRRDKQTICSFHLIIEAEENGLARARSCRWCQQNAEPGLCFTFFGDAAKPLASHAFVC